MLSNRLNRSRLLTLSFIATIAALVLVLQAFFLTPNASAQAAAKGTPIEVTGVLTILREDWRTGSRTFYLLESAGRRYALRFATQPPKHLRTGDHIRVRGMHAAGSSSTSVPVDGTLALGSDSTSLQTLTPAPVPNTFGEQKTLVILLNFQDIPTQPYTLAYAQSVVFGTTSNLFLENSYRQTWLTGDVVGWYTIPLNSTVCDQLGLASYAKQASTAAGVDLSAYTHYVYAFPQNPCAWWGTATVGGSPSQSWINGSLVVDVVGHEMGHNLGLEHSHSLVCTDGSIIGPTCTTLEYGDGIDIMGWSPSGHYNAFQKERLGWLNHGASPPITTVQASSTYVLDPYEPPGTNPKALKILKSTNPTTGYRDWYYVEFRQAIGFDSIIVSDGRMDSANILNGVVVHMGSEDNGGNTNGLLDMTPATYQLYTRDPTLVVGQSFTDPDAGVTITTQWVNSSNAGVSVSLNQPCVRANPTVALSPVQSQSVSAGTPVNFAVSVTNNDSANCSAGSFSLQATVPSGWTSAVATATLTISSGSTASTTLTVTSSTAATDGSYAIGVTVTDSANPTYTATAAATYVIGTSFSVTVATDKPSYTRTQTVSVKAKVNVGGAPVAGSTVNFTVTKSNGAVANGKATTGTDGTAVYKLRLKKQDPVGTYQAGAVATENVLSGRATTSFTVQ